MAGQARVLSSKEISDIFKMLETPRDRALFGLGVYTGMRIGEIIRLKHDQIHTTSGGVRNLLKVIRLKKKNTVYREIPVHPKLWEKLLLYKGCTIGAGCFIQTSLLTDILAGNVRTTFYATPGERNPLSTKRIISTLRHCWRIFGTNQSRIRTFVILSQLTGLLNLLHRL